MNWRITSINNLTHWVEVTRSWGFKHDFIVPEQYAVSHDAKNAYIKSQAETHFLKLLFRRLRNRFS